MARANTKDWRNLPVEKWNATTYREYLKHLHYEELGAKYVPFSYSVESAMIKQAYTEYGKPAVKRFIEICIEEYRRRKNRRYAGINFGFMWTYRRNNMLKALKDIQREETMRAKVKTTATLQNLREEDFSDWV